MITDDIDPFEEIREQHKAIIKLAYKRRTCVGVEQGGARLPLVPYGEMSIFNRDDFNWLAWESHHVINLALAELKRHKDYDAYMKSLEEDKKDE